MSKRSIPAHVIARQIEAADPEKSFWVTANAGAGKTHVLAQRVIRLLLEGAEPGKILCITYTKAAAANMANRVFETLSRWTRLDDAELDTAIAAVGSTRPTPEQRVAARRLFARALETPGGLKVQTIHAFCTRLLHQFPFEANVSARFTVIEDAAQAQLLHQATTAVLLDAAAAPETPLGRALAYAITAAADSTFREVVTDAIKLRARLKAWTGHAGSVDGAITALSQQLGAQAGDTRDSLDLALFDEAVIPQTQWVDLIAALETGIATDKKVAEKFRLLALAGSPRRSEDYLDIFFTREPKPRASIVTKSIRDNHAHWHERLLAEQQRVMGWQERRNAVQLCERTAALLTLVEQIIARYAVEKERRGLLDFDDLIARTATMLTRDTAPWVLYKLDGGIDHVLIDEAQDTSPPQWDIVRNVVAEFSAGAGARTIKRTVFVVGDDKQSIFSFQGAQPAYFATVRQEFARLFSHPEAQLTTIPLHASFRSGAAVLGAVDKVFGRAAAYSGFTADPVATEHEALPDMPPGLVEIWDTVKPDPARDDITAWDAPFDTQTETSPQVRLAQRIAATASQWRADGGRAGDILVLVRKRGALFEAIIRALKNEGVPVAGADRLVLTEHIAVMDLMVLADALLLPEDDLALATVLRSPLFDVSDDDLYMLAYGRPGSLRAALRARREPLFVEAEARLSRLAAMASRTSPFAFYAHVLGAEHGRRRFRSRLGAEAMDALDEFLSLALAFEAGETPSLQGFVAWLRNAEMQVKRDMEMTQDEVRVMTVHGAKGLESRFVILADTTGKPAGLRAPRLIPLPADAAAPDALVWCLAKKFDTAPLAAARAAVLQAERDEHARLLYVALTRAEEKLVICGAEGAQKRAEGCWYDLVHDALADDSEAIECDGESVWRYPPGAVIQLTPTLSSTSADNTREDLLRLDRPAPDDPAGPRTLSPSSAYDETHVTAATPAARADATALVSTLASARLALARGRLMHRLLQALPEIAPERRDAAAKTFLARNAADFTPDDHAAMLEQARRILDDPAFAALFAAGSRAEVPIAGRLKDAVGNRVMVNGQIDRLAVTETEILIGDFKTNRPPPRRIADVPPAYVAQLALYRAVLAKLYPGRIVRAALIWTETPDLMEIPADRLDAALAVTLAPSVAVVTSA
ncbi:MAG TPA: double-strand break repair helicase AddA [Xanthobacteraceae bacterium]|jgi:ATP-dependent helicase/nuclease subunit A|nr:double-strand break repair helicase AddA [Xanthobacteraceae bacterium]